MTFLDPLFWRDLYIGALIGLGVGMIFVVIAAVRENGRGHDD